MLAWLRNAVPVSVAPGQPMIAVVIDDMGLDRVRSERVAALPPPLTLAYLTAAAVLGQFFTFLDDHLHIFLSGVLDDDDILVTQ